MGQLVIQLRKHEHEVHVLSGAPDMTPEGGDLVPALPPACTAAVGDSVGTPVVGAVSTAHECVGRG